MYIKKPPSPIPFIMEQKLAELEQTKVTPQDLTPGVLSYLAQETVVRDLEIKLKTARQDLARQECFMHEFILSQPKNIMRITKENPELGNPRSYSVRKVSRFQTVTKPRHQKALAEFFHNISVKAEDIPQLSKAATDFIWNNRKQTTSGPKLIKRLSVKTQKRKRGGSIEETDPVAAQPMDV